MRVVICIAPLFMLAAVAAAQDDTVINSKHDLSSLGPGPIRAVHEDRVCIFCHAPHNASPAAPLWNRTNPTTHYRIYESRTTDARIDQPGPGSKMCLSCHDGSIGLGMTLHRAPTDPILLNQPFMPSGASNLTNDLSDDHPIGFRFDRALANRDPQLRQPQLVDHRIKLGDKGLLECIACHDPHNNELGNFLRVTDREGALCQTCHDMFGWRSSSHALAGNPVPFASTNGEPRDYVSMRDNACASCHVSHTAPEREQLLWSRPTQLCLDCHNGINATNIAGVINQRHGHQISPFGDDRRGRSDRPRLMRFVACTDCHNPHAVQGDGQGGFARETDPSVPPAMRYVPGVSLSGMPVQHARQYYEVCFQCHADFPVLVRDRVVRQRDTGGNIRREFVPTVASAHPVTFPARNNGENPSLRPAYRNQPFISCQSCHNNPNGRSAGGTEVDGPHGSPFDGLLVRRYETADFTMESPQAYALCYECHDRNSILGNESFEFHNVHVVRGRSPCSACHTAHGVAGSPTNHDHLINFDIAIVGGQRFYADTGRFSGTCTLMCHDVNHVNFTYGNDP